LVCFRYIIVNTLHKGNCDGDDDDGNDNEDACVGELNIGVRNLGVKVG